jgi:hypothetical protein
MDGYIFSGVFKVNAVKRDTNDKNIADYFIDDFLVEEPLRIAQFEPSAREIETDKVSENSEINLAAQRDDIALRQSI